jgi:hypothetical protein
MNLNLQRLLTVVRRKMNAEKSRCMLPPRHQIVGKNYDRKIANKFFENVEQFKYL